jgi:hypothetical protein
MNGAELYLIIPLILGAVAVLGVEIRKNANKVIEGQVRVALSLGELVKDVSGVRAEVVSLKKQLEEIQRPQGP